MREPFGINYAQHQHQISLSCQVIERMTMGQVTTCRHHSDANILTQSLERLECVRVGSAGRGPYLRGVGTEVVETPLTDVLWQPGAALHSHPHV